MTLQEFAAATNMDLEGTVARFAGMEAMVKRFLKKFADDPTFSQLSAAVAEKDYHTIETSAHTLKGVAGNLGFGELFDLNQKIVDAVRSQEYDKIDGLFAENSVLYERIIGALKTLA